MREGTREIRKVRTGGNERVEKQISRETKVQTRENGMWQGQNK